MTNLSNQTDRKFIDSINVDDWEVETIDGWVDIENVHKTIEYEVYRVTLDDGTYLECADDHILFDDNMSEIYAKDCMNKWIQTKSGLKQVISVESLNYSENMYDLSVAGNHTYFTNNILSHNSTITCAYILWYILFNDDKTVGILANKAETAREILSKVQLGFIHLPKWLQHGIVDGGWNKGSIHLENNSRVFAAATSSDAIRGYSLNYLFIDEAAHIDNWDEFFTSVYPTISSGKTTKVTLVSTPNGLNHFHKICQLAKEKKNEYVYTEVQWHEVPGRDEKWKQTTLAGMSYDMDKFAQEFEVEWLGSSGTLIAGWKLKELIAKTPLMEKNGVRQYEHVIPDSPYVVVADTARGKGLDYSAFSVFYVGSMPYRQVLTYRDNLISPIDYAEFIHRIALMYNNASVLIENNDIGQQVADVIHLDYEYENVMQSVNAGRDGKKITAGFGSKSERGIRTTKTVKSIGCSMIKMLIEQNQIILNDYNTISEFSTFSRKANSYEAESGHNDDLVMCCVLFGWLSNQEYFKELTEVNTLQHLREKNEEEIISQLMPFGVVDDHNELEIDYFNPSTIVGEFEDVNWDF